MTPVQTHRPPPAKDLLRACVPGGLRLSMYVYDPVSRQYRPVPKRHIRVAVDNVDQAEVLWKAMVTAVRAEVDGWPPSGDAVDEEYVLETHDDNADDGGD